MRHGGSTDFDVVRGICNGTKHVSTNASHNVPFTSGTDWDRPPAFAGVMIMGVSVLGDKKGGREIRTGAGGRVDIYHACNYVLTNFKTKFPKHLSNCDLTNC